MSLCVRFVKMEDLDLPEIKRKKIQEKKEEDKKEFKDLFESDSDSDDGDGFQLKGKLTLAHSAFTRGKRPFETGRHAPASGPPEASVFCFGSSAAREQSYRVDDS